MDEQDHVIEDQKRSVGLRIGRKSLRKNKYDR